MPTLNVRITNEDGGTFELQQAFTYTYPGPTIASVSPNTGPSTGGTTVTITGTGFQPGVVVEFGVHEAQVITVTPTAIICITPPAD